MRKIKQILVCPVGFVSDHLEILYDLDVEAKEYANSLGIALARVSSLNDDATFIEALAAVVRPLITKRLTVTA
jgi:ferrochelatase